MRNLRLVADVAVALLLTLTVSNAATAAFFSIDAGSPQFGLVSNSDVLTAGPIGGPPVVAIPAAGLGIAGAPADELNAMATPHPLNLLFFSVDPASVGVPGAPPDVFSEAGVAQAEGDIFSSLLVGANALFTNQDVLGLLPPIAPGVPTAAAKDNLDALDFLGGAGLLFAMAPGHPALGASGFVGCGADLFFAGPVPAISFAGLGLVACADDIDGMAIDSATGDLFFSLAPGSPSLFAAATGCAGGCSAADIFLAPGGAGPSSVVFPAATLGLLPTDNVDALAWDPLPAGPVPVMGPIGVALLALLLVTAAVFAIRSTRSAA